MTALNVQKACKKSWLSGIYHTFTSFKAFFLPSNQQITSKHCFQIFLEKMKVVWIVVTGRWDLMGWPLWRHCGGGELLEESDCCSRLELASPTHQRPNHLTPEPNPSHGTPKMDQKGAKNGLKKDPVLLSIYDSWYTKTVHLLLFQYLMKWLTYWGQWYWQCFGTIYEKWKTF